MTKIDDVIELNGKRYHARTGAYLGDHTAQPAAATTSSKPSTAARRTASHIPAHRPQPTRTLMRRAVPTPQAAIAKPHIKTQTPVQPAAIIPKAPIKSKLTVTAIDPRRSHRATTVDRSRLVKRFQSNQTAAATAAPMAAIPTAPIAPQTIAAPAPVTAANTLQPTANRPVAIHTDLTAAKPIKKADQPAYNAAHSAPSRPAHLRSSLRRQAPATATPAVRKTTTSSVQFKPQKDEDAEEQDIFERALAMATSHEQQPPKQSLLKSAKRRKRVRRLASLAAGMAVFVLLASFIAYQNKASIQMQMASAKAGFAATDPVYKPDGYAMGKVAYEPGTVTTMYNKSDKSFSIVQKQSNWDSQTLLENFVATSNEEYQGYESNGRTIYLFGNGKATWVDGGIWYQINAGNVLPTDQLVKVAASM